jgi:hypothetical protein
MLPAIADSTAFWSSLLTIWAAVGAWFTFFGAANDSRHRNHEDIMNLLTGIDAELELVSLWAGGGVEEKGYLHINTNEQLVKLHPDWFDPSRQIFTFDTPSLQSFTTSAQLRYLPSIVRPLVRLNYSIRRVFDLHDELRTFAHSHPALFDSVSKKLAVKPNTFTPDEQTFLSIVFGFNRRIHEELIGGEDSTDELCLYKAYRTATASIETFRSKAKPEPLPRWYWLLTLVATVFAALGAWELLRWLRVL